MKRYVLDASALMTFFEDRPGAQKVEELLRRAAESQRFLLLSVINWGEVYYSVWRAQGKKTADEKLKHMAQLPLEIMDVDLATTKLAAEWKATYKLPYADCFAAALARQQKATLVTTDRDFTQVEKQIDILWPAKRSRD